jgi:small-conductance mechanosensitive channel
MIQNLTRHAGTAWDRMSTLTAEQVLLPLLTIAAGLVAGYVLDGLLRSWLTKKSSTARLEWYDVIIDSLKGKMVLWLGIAGIHGAVLQIASSKSVIEVSRNIAVVIVIFTMSLSASRAAVGFMDLYLSKKEGVLPSTSIFSNITRVLIITVGVLIMLQYLGISIAPILTALGVGGLAVALALQDTLSNVFAGLQIIVSQQIKPGDYVLLDTGGRGWIEDISWRNTTVKDLDNSVTIIPNAKLATSVIVNHSLPEPEVVVQVPVGVAYASDLEAVERITIDTARKVLQEVEGGIKSFDPSIRYTSFGDSSINFNVKLRARHFTDGDILRHEFIKRLHVRYREEGIEIPFPVRTLYIKNN